MQVKQEACIGCGKCLVYCPARAIAMENKKAYIHLDRCVECRTCMRCGICPGDAFEQAPLTWPRVVRAFFSDANFQRENTEELKPYSHLLSGMKLEGAKLADVSGRYQSGRTGVAIELGRPGIPTSFHEVQRFTRLVAGMGVEFDANAVTRLITDVKTGDIMQDILDEIAFSVVIGFTIPDAELPAVLGAIIEESKDIDTVFSLDVICLANADGSFPACRILDDANIPYRPNGKTNVGLAAKGRVLP